MPPPNPLPPRPVLYVTDVMKITGRRERSAYELLRKIRKKYNKPKDGFVSIDDFCEFTGLREERIVGFLV
ncbi:MAG: hypothetical protein ACO1OO_12905 [Flavisolibacter sp.]